MNYRINVPKRTSPFTGTTLQQGSLKPSVGIIVEKIIYPSEAARLLAEARAKEAEESFQKSYDPSKDPNVAQLVDTNHVKNNVNVDDVKKIETDPKTKNMILIGSAVLGVLVITYIVFQSTK